MAGWAKWAATGLPEYADYGWFPSATLRWRTRGKEKFFLQVTEVVKVKTRITFSLRFEETGEPTNHLSDITE